MANALLFDDALIDRKPEGEVRLTSLEPGMWESDPARGAGVYELLCAAHYRTSPLDLRRMMDAPGQHFAVAQAGAEIAGALWLVEEGGLPPELSRAVWAGFRRPRGNLVAQSLAAHGGSPLAAPPGSQQRVLYGDGVVAAERGGASALRTGASAVMS